MARTGPNTPESKAVVRLNAVQHGIFAADPVIAGVEDPEEWQAFRAKLVGALAPVGGVEELLAERAAALAWRLRRVERYEADVIAVGLERVEHDYGGDDPERGAISKYYLYQGKPRSLPAARAKLEAAEACLDLLTRLPKLSAGADIEDDVIETLFQLIDDKNPASLDAPLPAFPNGVRDGGSEGWNALVLRAALSQLAEADSHTLADLLTWATEKATAQVRERDEELVFVEEELNRMHRERHLPHRSAMQNITRYGSGLNRKLYQALHELEASQARRNGSATPLAPLGDTIRRPMNRHGRKNKKVQNNYARRTALPSQGRVGRRPGERSRRGERVRAVGPEGNSPLPIWARGGQRPG